jgi:hypothetical protein
VGLGGRPGHRPTYRYQVVEAFAAQGADPALRYVSALSSQYARLPIREVRTSPLRNRGGLATPAGVDIADSGFGIVIADRVNLTEAVPTPTATFRLTVAHTPAAVEVTGNLTLDDLRKVWRTTPVAQPLLLGRGVVLHQHNPHPGRVQDLQPRSSGSSWSSTTPRVIATPGYLAQWRSLEDILSNLPTERAIREKHGMLVGTDEELAASLIADNRILLAVTPTRPVSEWSVLGVEAWGDNGLDARTCRYVD